MHLEIADDIAHLECLNARLPRTEDLALAAYLEVLFGDLKTVGRFFHNAEPFFCNRSFFAWVKQDAETLFGTTTTRPRN